MLQYSGRVWEISQSEGREDIDLAGSLPRHVTFSNDIKIGNQIRYRLVHLTSNEWEHGTGTLVSANTITRDQVYSSTNNNRKVNFSSGFKSVYLSLSGEDFDAWRLSLSKFNVLDNGATGDGVTDDTLAIRETFQEAKNAGGGIVFFPKGKYIVRPQSDNITNFLHCIEVDFNNIAIEGEGIGVTEILYRPYSGLNPDNQYLVIDWRGNGNEVFRGSVFKFTGHMSGSVQKNIFINNLSIKGNASYITGSDARSNPNISTGIGFDQSHRALNFSNTTFSGYDNLYVDTIEISGFRGEGIFVEEQTDNGLFQIENISIFECAKCQAIHGKSVETLNCNYQKAFFKLVDDNPAFGLYADNLLRNGDYTGFEVRSNDEGSINFIQNLLQEIPHTAYNMAGTSNPSDVLIASNVFINCSYDNTVINLDANGSNLEEISIYNNTITLNKPNETINKGIKLSWNDSSNYMRQIVISKNVLQAKTSENAKITDTIVFESTATSPSGQVSDFYITENYFLGCQNAPRNLSIDLQPQPVVKGNVDTGFLSSDAQKFEVDNPDSYTPIYPRVIPTVSSNATAPIEIGFDETQHSNGHQLTLISQNDSAVRGIITRNNNTQINVKSDWLGYRGQNLSLEYNTDLDEYIEFKRTDINPRIFDTTGLDVNMKGRNVYEFFQNPSNRVITDFNNVPKNTILKVINYQTGHSIQNNNNINLFLSTDKILQRNSEVDFFEYDDKFHEIHSHIYSSMALFNVRDYGALLNGVNDDSTAINRTIDAARNAGGGIVIIDGNVYLENTYSSGDVKGHIRAFNHDNIWILFGPSTIIESGDSDAYVFLIGSAFNDRTRLDTTVNTNAPLDSNLTYPVGTSDLFLNVSNDALAFGDGNAIFISDGLSGRNVNWEINFAISSNPNTGEIDTRYPLRTTHKFTSSSLQVMNASSPNKLFMEHFRILGQNTPVYCGRLVNAAQIIDFEMSRIKAITSNTDPIDVHFTTAASFFNVELVDEYLVPGQTNSVRFYSNNALTFDDVIFKSQGNLVLDHDSPGKDNTFNDLKITSLNYTNENNSTWLHGSAKDTFIVNSEIYNRTRSGYAATFDADSSGHIKRFKATRGDGPQNNILRFEKDGTPDWKLSSDITAGYELETVEAEVFSEKGNQSIPINKWRGQTLGASYTEIINLMYGWILPAGSNEKINTQTSINKWYNENDGIKLALAVYWANTQNTNDNVVLSLDADYFTENEPFNNTTVNTQTIFTGGQYELTRTVFPLDGIQLPDNEHTSVSLTLTRQGSNSDDTLSNGIAIIYTEIVLVKDKPTIQSLPVESNSDKLIRDPKYANEDSIPEPDPFGANPQQYTYAEVVADVKNMANSAGVEAEMMGLSFGGNEQWAARLFDDGTKPIIVIAQGIHGNEITYNRATSYFMYKVINSQDKMFKDIRENLAIYFIATMNPDGMIGNKRATNNGINLNRQFPFYWDAAPDPDKGTAPFSEPESANLREYLKNKNAEGRIILGIDLHGWESRQVWGLLNEQHWYTEESEQLQRATFLYAKHMIDARDWSQFNVVYNTPLLREYRSKRKPYLYTYLRSIGAPTAYAGLIEYPVGEDSRVINLGVLDILYGISKAALDQQTRLLPARQVSPALIPINDNSLFDTFDEANQRPHYYRSSGLGIEYLPDSGPGGKPAIELRRISVDNWPIDQSAGGYISTPNAFVFAGGEDSPGVEIDTTVIETWEGTRPVQTSLPVALKRGAMASNGNTIWHFGGWNGSYYDNLYEADLSDVENVSWTKINDLGVFLQRHTMHYWNGKLIIVGGRNSSGYKSNIEQHDLSTGITTTIGNLQLARGWHASTIDSDDILWVFGGWDGANALQSIETFNLNTDTTASQASIQMPAPRRKMAFVTQDNTTFMFCGDDGTNRQDNIYLFNHNNQTITDLQYELDSEEDDHGNTYTIEPPRVTEAAAVADPNGFNFFLIGGETDSGLSNNVYQFDGEEITLRGVLDSSYGWFRSNNVFYGNPGEQYNVTVNMKNQGDIELDKMPYVRITIYTGPLNIIRRKVRHWYPIIPQDWTTYTMPITLDENETEFRVYVRVYGGNERVRLSAFQVFNTPFGGEIVPQTGKVTDIQTVGLPNIDFGSGDSISGVLSPVWGTDQGNDVNVLSFTPTSDTTSLEDLTLRFTSPVSHDNLSGTEYLVENPTGTWELLATINGVTQSVTGDAGWLNHTRKSRTWRREIIKWELTLRQDEQIQLDLWYYGKRIPLVLDGTGVTGSIIGYRLDGSGVRLPIYPIYRQLSSTLVTSMIEYLERYTRDTKPLIANSQGLVTNAVHDTELGRGGYFPNGAGTTESQFLITRALARAAVQGVQEAGDPSRFYTDAADAYYNTDRLDTVETTQDGEPILTLDDEPIVFDTNRWLPHWLIMVKGSQQMEGPINTTTNNPDNRGYIMEPVSVTNGEGQIPVSSDGDKLSRVFNAWSDGTVLAWDNVFAAADPSSTNPIKYEIEWYVDTDQLKWYNDSTVEQTNDAPGSFKLTQNISRTVLLNYAIFINETAGPGDLIDAWPVWYKRFIGDTDVAAATDAQTWSLETYDLMYEWTGDDIYKVKGDKTEEEIQKFVIENTVENRLLTLHDGTGVFDFSITDGTPKVFTDKNTPVSGTRNASNQLEIVQDPDPGNFNLAGFERGGVKITFNNDTNLVIDASSSTGKFTVWFVDTVDFTGKIYSTWVNPANASALGTYTINTLDFIDNDSINWWALNTPDFLTFNIGTNSSYDKARNKGLVNSNVDPRQPLVDYVDISANNQDYVNFDVPLYQSHDRSTVPIITAEVVTPSWKMRILDADGWLWSYTLPVTSGIEVIQPSWNDFSLDSDQPNNTLPGPSSPNTSGTITEFNIQLDTTGAGRIKLSIVSDQVAPNWIPNPTELRNLRVGENSDQGFTLTLGDIYFEKSPDQNLPYAPGVLPFTGDFKGDPLKLISWRGPPYTGYQSVYPWWRQGDTAKALNVFEFWRDAQDAYNTQIGVAGPFAPVYILPKKDMIFYDSPNTWTWEGPDPNTFWGGFQARCIFNLAQGWYLFKDNPQLPSYVSTVTDKYLDFMLEFMRDNNNSVPMNFPRNGPPTSFYADPHAIANTLKGVYYAKAAGSTFAGLDELISRLEVELDKYRVRSGPNAGSYALGSDNIYYGFWHGEILEAFVLKRELNINVGFN